MSDPLPWGPAPGLLGCSNRPGRSRDPLVQTRDYGRVHQRPDYISRRLRGLVRGRQELRGAGEHLYSEAHFPAKARSGRGTVGDVGREWAWALQCHQGDAERGGAARALAFRCSDFSTLQRDWSVFPGTLDWRTGVVDLLEALGGAHPGQTKQRLETSNLLAVL